MRLHEMENALCREKPQQTPVQRELPKYRDLDAQKVRQSPETGIRTRCRRSIIAVSCQTDTNHRIDSVGRQQNLKRGVGIWYGDTSRRHRSEVAADVDRVPVVF